MPDPLLEISGRLYELLGRQRIEIEQEQLRAHLAGKDILITGGAGSIGSALAELVARLGPASLTLLDVHENSLFRLRQQLLAAGSNVPCRFVLADVRDARRIAQVLDLARPQVVFHLAAYKHVPFAEDLAQEFAAVNVLGTWRLLQESRRAGVAHFVYPSTDKAVNPPSVYGATKRCSELMLQAAAADYPSIQINAVRLVNVLGASGGVVETFVRQMSSGLPVTITDPRMTRYWITMDEALHLLTAGCSEGTGKVLLLDLGEPIKVTMVAERLWAMLGSDGEPLRAEICGSRPGERLVEELTYSSEELVRSDWPGILQIIGGVPIPRLARVEGFLAEIENIAERGDLVLLRQALFDFAYQAGA